MSDQEAGFTLLETLIAVLIAGLAAALALPAIADGTRRYASHQVEYNHAEQALSLLALLEAEASLDDYETLFSDWDVRYIALPETEIVRQETVPVWLEIEYVPTGESYRKLIFRGS